MRPKEPPISEFQFFCLYSPLLIESVCMRYILCANWSVISLVEVPGRELHTTSFVNTARTTRKVMRNVTRRGNVLEELARRMRPTRIVDLTTTYKKTSKKT